jgi:hypothetical protein
MEVFASLPVPIELVRAVFADAGEVRARELRQLMPSIVLQSVADGRILVLMNSSIVAGSLAQLTISYLSYFEKFRVPCTFTVGKETNPADSPIKLPKTCTSVTIRVSGFLQCSATFSYVSELPRNMTCPLLCVGFAAPPDAERLTREFEGHLPERELPFLDLTAIARQRVRIEGRNRDYLLQTGKTRQELSQRYAKADQTLRRRRSQLEILEKDVEQLLGAKPPPPAKLVAVERTIERLGAEINELAAHAEKLAKAADAKTEGRGMTRKEEAALLDALKNQVRDARRQLDALT